jgi:serine/threonine protein kinase
LIPCRGYTPPEFASKQEISSKYDVFSLGVVIIHMIAGRKHYYDHVDTPSKIIELVSDKFLNHELVFHEVMLCFTHALYVGNMSTFCFHLVGM